MFLLRFQPIGKCMEIRVALINKIECVDKAFTITVSFTKIPLISHEKAMKIISRPMNTAK